MSKNFIMLIMLFHVFLLIALLISLVLHNELQHLSMSTFIILILCNFTAFFITEIGKLINKGE